MIGGAKSIRKSILNPPVKNYSNKMLLNILLYGSEDFNCNTKKKIRKARIKFLKISERFNGLLFRNICPNGTCFSYIF